MVMYSTCVCVFGCYLATGHNPVGDGEEGEAHSDPQHSPAHDPHRLLPQTRQVLIPDGQKLLLAVWMGHKLHKNRMKDG